MKQGALSGRKILKLALVSCQQPVIVIHHVHGGAGHIETA